MSRTTSRRAAGNTRNGGTPKTLLTTAQSGSARRATGLGASSPRSCPRASAAWTGPGRQDRGALRGRDDDPRDRDLPGRVDGPGVGRDTVSRVTAAVLDDANAWQTRPLEAIYPIVHLDAMIVKIRDGQAMRNFACYMAIGVNTDGERDVRGMWFERTEGAKFWLQVLTDLKQRGLQDVLVCCVDGLTGFPETIEAAPRDLGADVSGPSGPLEPAVCALPRPARRRRRPQEDLHLR